MYTKYQEGESVDEIDLQSTTHRWTDPTGLSGGNCTNSTKHPDAPFAASKLFPALPPHLLLKMA